MAKTDVTSLKKTTSLTSSWWVFVRRAALGASLAAAGCTSVPKPDHTQKIEDAGAPGSADPPPRDDATRTIDMDDIVILPAKEEARRARINAALMQQARREVLKLNNRGSYSQELDGLQDRLTRFLKSDRANIHNRVLVIDPGKFDVAMALGFSAPQAVRLLLTEQKLTPTGEMAETVAGKAAAPYAFRYGVQTFSQDPFAMMNTSRTHPAACVIVPSSDHALTIDIRGLNAREQVNFTNRHEGWHCLDDKYTLRSFDPKKLAAVPQGTLMSKIANLTALGVFAMEYRKEAVADVGAIGDMIRQDGYDTGLIDKIVAWRMRYPNDIQHLSAPVLHGFKAKIDEMGIDAFHRLDDAAAKQLYFDVTDQYGMSARSLQINLKLEKGTVPERLQWLEAAKTDPEAAKAIDFFQYYWQKPADPGAGPLSSAEIKLAGALRSWNAAQLLEDRAFKDSGRITPVTLAAAYGALQDELHAHTRSDPRNPLYAAQMTKLQESFVWRVQDTDYVEANLKRGVDIVAADPALKPFRAKGRGL